MVILGFLFTPPTRILAKADYGNLARDKDSLIQDVVRYLVVCERGGGLSDPLVISPWCH